MAIWSSRLRIACQLCTGRTVRNVTALLRFVSSVADLREQLSELPHDYDGQPAVMTKAHMAHALRRFIKGDITATDLEQWDDLVEGRPGIEYQTGYERILEKALFQLSTPDINRPITIAMCWRLLKEVQEGTSLPDSD